MYGLYYFIHMFRQFDIFGFITNESSGRGKYKNKDNKLDNYNYISVILLSLWLFYVLMISDGFRFSNTNKRQYRGVVSDENSKNSIKYLVYTSFIYIIFSFFINLITNQTCEKWKDVNKVNNTKEIQANIITTSICALLLISTINYF